MADGASLPDIRAEMRRHYLADEATLARRLVSEADVGAAARDRAQANAAKFVKEARANAARSGLIDKFLQEYGLSTAEGVTLMRLAEALLRTPDAATADSLIRDKVEAGDWAAHKGKSPFPLVNFSTRALMLTAAWLDDVEANDPARRIVRATKDLFDRVGEPVIRASVAQAMKVMGEHFVLGETIEDAMRRGRSFAAKGYSFSFDMLGEAAYTAADAHKYFNEYAGAIEAIAANANADHPRDNPGISVKLSALHPRYEFTKRERVLKELGSRTRELAIAAKNANIGFNIDAEESWRLDLSLEIIGALLKDPALAGWDGFGVVVQAYQRRAGFVIDWLAEAARSAERRIMIRLVKGAYWDSEIKRAQVLGLASYPVFTRKVLTDISYQACARRILGVTHVVYPQFATHNAFTAAIVREMAGDYADYELQRLHGMGEALHDSLIEAGARSRIYAPVGGHKELLPYLVRRLLENGANSSFVNQLIDPDLAVEEVVADPVEEARNIAVYPNPSIPAPCDLFDGTRLQAEGYDPSEPDVAAALERSVSSVNADTGAPLIDGRSVPGERTEIFNPADRTERVGVVGFASASHVEHACERAAAAADAWKATPARERGAILHRAAALLEKRADHFMAIAVREAGKTIPDAIAEVREAVDFLRYYGNGAIALEGEPLGVVACISPWNFPLAIFLGQVSAALAAGNAVVAKPAEQTPLIALAATQLLHDAGIPPGALHCLPGDGPSVGGPLVAHPAVKGVVFTGSTPTAQRINRALADAGKADAALIAETGGINAMIIDSTALLEQAVADVVASAFQSAGQRCSACRLVCVQEDIADRFIEMLGGVMDELAIGDPSLLVTDVGPVIDEDAHDVIARHIAEMKSNARLIREAADDASGEGCFILPAAFELESISDLEKEVFGPVLHVVRFGAEALDAVVDEINALGFGLTLGIHTRIDETMHAIVRRAHIGNLYVNRNQIGAVVGVQPFGGEGLSGTGPKAGGPHYLKALVRRPPRKATDGHVKIVDRPLNAAEQKALEDAASAFAPWHEAQDRGDLLRRAAQAAHGEARHLLMDAAEIYARSFAETETLPGPTGESNTLRLKGRGIALCLGPDESLPAQIARCLAAGNTVVAAGRIAGVAEALRAADLVGVVAAIEPSRDVSEALVLDSSIRTIVYDGAGAAPLQTLLTRRSGPILTLLSTADDLWRFAAERTLTINTTAAGGDVRLLSLTE